MEHKSFEEYRAARAAYARSWYAKRKDDPVFREKVNRQTRERRKRNPEKRHKERVPNLIRMLQKYKNDPEYREHVSQYHKKRKSRRRYWLNKYKEAVGCVKCQYNKHGAALDFHHEGHSAKEKEVSSMLGGSLKLLFTEVRKCLVLCSNCHRILHYEETNGEVF